MGVRLTRRERRSMKFHASRQTHASSSTISLSPLLHISLSRRDSLEDIAEHAGPGVPVNCTLLHIALVDRPRDDGASLIRREYPRGIPTRPSRVTPETPRIIGQQSFRARHVTRAVSTRIKLPTHRIAAAD